MKRRKLVTGAALGAVTTGAIAACAPRQEKFASSDTPYLKWQLASSYTPELDTVYGGSEYFVERVKQLTNGRFEIALSAEGELVPGLEILEAVQQGRVQAGHTSSYYYRDRNEALAFDTAVPFGLDYRQQNAWLYQGGGLDLVHELLADFNIISFPAGNTGAQMGGWWRREVQTLADLKGLTMRIPGLGGTVMERLGVTVKNLAGSEILLALQQGRLDAAEWVGPYDDHKLGLHQAAPIYYYPGWWEPASQYSFYFNLDAWRSLPTTYQDMLKTAAAETHLDIMARYDSRNPGAIASLLSQGVTLKPFPPEIMVAAHTVSFDLYEELAAKDAAYKKLYTAWQAFRAASNQWFATAELSYTNFAFPPLS